MKRFGSEECMRISIICVIFSILAMLALVFASEITFIFITVIMMLIAASAVVHVNILYPEMLEFMPNGKEELSTMCGSSKFLLIAVVLQTLSF